MLVHFSVISMRIVSGDTKLYFFFLLCIQFIIHCWALRSSEVDYRTFSWTQRTNFHSKVWNQFQLHSQNWQASIVRIKLIETLKMIYETQLLIIHLNDKIDMRISNVSIQLENELIDQTHKPYNNILFPIGHIASVNRGGVWQCYKLEFAVSWKESRSESRADFSCRDIFRHFEPTVAFSRELIVDARSRDHVLLNACKLNGLSWSMLLTRDGFWTFVRRYICEIGNERSRQLKILMGFSGSL